METIAGHLSFNNSVILEKVENEYFIKWNSNLIIPDLNNTDKLRMKTIEAKRGSIYDRYGNMLAGEGQVLDVGFVPGKMNAEPQEDIKKVAELLGITEEKINKGLSASYVKEDTFVKIGNVALDNTALENELLQIPGIKIYTVAGRVYPYAESASHLTGYIGAITKEELEKNEGKGYTENSIIGKNGIEKAYEDKLRGIEGYDIYIEDSNGNKKKDVISKKEKDGENIKLTIDMGIQNCVNEQFKNDESATVVINPKTGEILAMCSNPEYNANDFILGMSDSKWQELNADERNPLYNRLTGCFAPRFII